MKCAIVLNTPERKRRGPDEPEVCAPQTDYVLLAESLNAKIISGGPASPNGLLKSRFLYLLAQAWRAYRRRGEYDLVITMSEQVGLLLALLFKITRCDKIHVMICHYVTPPRKSLFLKLLRVDTRITKFICYGSTQGSFLTETLGIEKGKVEVVLHPADSQFWKPMPGPTEPLVIGAGLLARDYPTLLRAVEGLDVELVIAAASPWMNGSYQPPSGKVSERVKFVTCTPAELRELYARSHFVVVPLVPVDVQAGSLVIYESMAMGRAVVTSATGGNVDIVKHGETGYYVPPQDHVALRGAISHLLENPEIAQRMGARARELVDQGLNLNTYVDRVTRFVYEAHAQGDPGSKDASKEIKGALRHVGIRGRSEDST